MKSKKILVIIICSAILIGAAVSITAIKNKLSPSQTSQTTYIVKKEIYKNEISVSGTVSAAQEQTLQALSDGTVVAVFVKQGDKVKKDDTIIQLDDTTQQYNLAKHDYEMETTRISGSRKELALKETERLSLLQKISERKVLATFDGIIADIDVSVGDSLEAKDSVGTLVDASYLIADVEIPETDVAKLKTQQSVEFTFPSYDGTVNGYVVGWPAIGEITDRGATIVKARLRIDEYPAEVLPNFSFSGKIKISPDQEFLIIERNAVGRDKNGAYAILDGTNEKIKITVEPYGKEYVKITSANLTEGQILSEQTAPKVSGTNRRDGPPPGGR